MANPWFRLYAEFANDAKVQMMSEADQRRFIMLLCIRCNGDVTLHDEEVAFQLRISNEEWATTKAVFLSKSLITDDNKPTAWDKRQFVSDSSAPRVAKHRAKIKEERNVTVTAPDTYTDTDTEKNKSKSPVGELLRGVSDQVAKDFQALRAKLKAPITKTAIAGIQREANAAGISLEDALTICIERSWRGFKAEWLYKDKPNARASPRQSIHEQRAETIAALTGQKNVHANRERDITGTAVVIT